LELRLLIAFTVICFTLCADYKLAYLMRHAKNKNRRLNFSFISFFYWGTLKNISQKEGYQLLNFSTDDKALEEKLNHCTKIGDVILLHPYLSGEGTIKDDKFPVIFYKHIKRTHIAMHLRCFVGDEISNAVGVDIYRRDEAQFKSLSEQGKFNRRKRLNK
jgi:hypothetical protein